MAGLPQAEICQLTNNTFKYSSYCFHYGKQDYKKIQMSISKTVENERIDDFWCSQIAPSCSCVLFCAGQSQLPNGYHHSRRVVAQVHRNGGLRYNGDQVKKEHFWLMQFVRQTIALISYKVFVVLYCVSGSDCVGRNYILIKLYMNRLYFANFWYNYYFVKILYCCGYFVVVYGVLVLRVLSLPFSWHVWAQERDILSGYLREKRSCFMFRHFW